jgi:peroxiredoxin
MQTRLVCAGILTVAAAASVLTGQQPLAQTPDVAFDGAAGRVVLRDFRGKQAVVLLFMRGFAQGMTCYYCGEQTREYQESYDKLHAAGAEVLMVLPLAKDIGGYVRKIGEGRQPAVPKLTLPFPVVLDSDGSACKAFAVPTKTGGTDPFPVEAPATIVISKDGAVLMAYHGQDPSDRPVVTAVLEVLRTGKATVAGVKAAVATAPTRTWSSYAEGMLAARAKRLPILLEFHAVW